VKCDLRAKWSRKWFVRMRMDASRSSDSRFPRYFHGSTRTTYAMDSKDQPKLRFLHSESALNRVKLDLFRRLPTAELRASLSPGREGSLKARADGTVLDGHHRLRILVERSEPIDCLPREIMDKEP
jgi:hypothetical protein